MISAVGILNDSANRVTKPNSVPIWRDDDVILSELRWHFKSLSKARLLN